MISPTQNRLLRQADANEAAPGRLLSQADTPELLELQTAGFIRKGPYHSGPERERLLRDVEAGIEGAMPLLGATAWWLTDLGRAQARRVQFSEEKRFS